MIVFKQGSTALSLTQLGEDKYRLSLQKATAQGASEEYSEAQMGELIDALVKAFVSVPEKPDEARVTALRKALDALADDLGLTLEQLDKQISSKQVSEGTKKPRAMTREEYLVELLGEETLEEVLAGKCSVSEALEAQSEELEAAGLDKSSEDSGDSLRA